MFFFSITKKMNNSCNDGFFLSAASCSVKQQFELHINSFIVLQSLNSTWHEGTNSIWFVLKFLTLGFCGSLLDVDFLFFLLLPHWLYAVNVMLHLNSIRMLCSFLISNPNTPNTDIWGYSQITRALQVEPRCRTNVFWLFSHVGLFHFL